VRILVELIIKLKYIQKNIIQPIDQHLSPISGPKVNHVQHGTDHKIYSL